MNFPFRVLSSFLADPPKEENRSGRTIIGEAEGPVKAPFPGSAVRRDAGFCIFPRDDG
jgi:hypothetical protein